MKHEWKKQEKALYLPGAAPVQITVPPQQFFVIDGEGNPNAEGFAEAIGVLYALSYGVKMLPKKGESPAGYQDYAIYPLEGIWRMPKGAGALDKGLLQYRVMMRQPGFVTPQLAAQVLEQAQKKKAHPLLGAVRFETLEDGPSVQLTHAGSFDTEPESFARMEVYLQENGLVRTGPWHREIYLSDARKTAPDKLRTVLRYPVHSRGGE